MTTCVKLSQPNKTMCNIIDITMIDINEKLTAKNII